MKARKAPALNEVYADEALPTAKGLTELGTDEQKALAAIGVSEFVTQVQTRRKQLYRSKARKTG